VSDFKNCRVLDLGIITAGAATSALLADLGAEVIKIESPTYRDPFRSWTNTIPLPGEQNDLPPFFRMTNRSKLSASIDLKNPAGREAFLRLVAKSDVVVENFRRGVLPRLGLGFADLKTANPNIILASISSQGEDGPDAGYASFGSTLEAMAGMAWLTGYRDGPPVVSGIEINYPDQVVAIFAASMITTAWLARRNGTGGTHLDLSQRELTSFLCGEAFLVRSDDQARLGNSQPGIPVQDCFRSKDGIWVAVTVEADRLSALNAMLPADANQQDRLVALVNWIGSETAATCIAKLKERGIAAAPVLDGIGVLKQEGRAWTSAMQRMPGGDLVKGFPFQNDSVPCALGPAAQTLGTHTVDILKRIGGYSDDGIRQLLAAGAVEIAKAAEKTERVAETARS
jgi:crotonobetainyl-CoA:carnitine CoA-transferase CaiB-like acyl-CoA transferase